MAQPEQPRSLKRILDAGAESVMVVAGTDGTGPQPDGVELFVVGTTGTTIMDGIRAFANAIISPSRELCAAVASFDPSEPSNRVDELSDTGCRSLWATRIRRGQN